MFNGNIEKRANRFGMFTSLLCVLGILLSWAVHGPGKNPHVLDVVVGVWLTSYLARAVFLYPSFLSFSAPVSKESCCGI
jgi:hypothetical protein